MIKSLCTEMIFRRKKRKIVSYGSQRGKLLKLWNVLILVKCPSITENVDDKFVESALDIQIKRL